MPHTRNPERLSHLPKVTQHRGCWWPGVTSLPCRSLALEAKGLSSFGAHDGWAVKVETLGYLDPGIRVPGEAIMKGRVWGKLRKCRELKGLSGQLELALCLSDSLKVTHPRKEPRKRMAS